MWSAVACYRFGRRDLGLAHLWETSMPIHHGGSKLPQNKAKASFRTPKESKIHTLIESFGTIIYENLLCVLS